MSQLTIQMTTQPGGETVVHVAGVADLGGAGELERALRALPSEHAKHVVFDLSRMTFISSISIGVLLKIRRSIVDTGGRVSLARVGRIVKETFTHAGLAELLPMFDTINDALASTPASKSSER